MVSDVMFSSDCPIWATPKDLFASLDSIWGFNLDVCAEAWNAKVAQYITKEQDAFETPWEWNGRSATAWMNPPYGGGEKACVQPHEKCKKKKCIKRGFHIWEDIPGIGDWVQRSVDQMQAHGTTTVMLVPSRTDTDWFQTIFSHAALICFMRGRIRFELPGGKRDTAPFPSVLAAMSPTDLEDEIYEEMSAFGNVFDPRQGQVILYNGGTR